MEILKKIMIILKNIILYSIGAIFLLIALSYVSDSILVGLLMGGAAILTFPITYSKLNMLLNGKIKAGVRTLIVIVMVFTGLIVTPESETVVENTNSNYEIEEAKTDDVVEVKSNNSNSSSGTSFWNIQKIDTALSDEDYEELSELYPELSSADKKYFVEQLEKYFKEILKEETFGTNTSIKELDEAWGYFKNLELNSQFMETLFVAIQRLNDYNGMLSKIPEYNGLIPEGSVETWLDVYVVSRVANSNEFIGEEYTDCYVAYGYSYDTYLGAIADYDSEMIIVYSKENLQKGVNNIRAVENGTYDTIDSSGFELSSRLFETYPQEEWDKYYAKRNADMWKERLNEMINIIKTEALVELAENDLEASQEALCKAGLRLFEGVWEANDNQVILHVFGIESGEENKCTIEIEGSALWTITNAYCDWKTGDIVYEGGICEDTVYLDSGDVTFPQRYSDGTGRIYIENGNLYWKDNKEGAGDNYKFEFWEG